MPHSPKNQAVQPALAKIALLLFLSGFCALTYQVAWMRSLRLVFGASTAASAAVLAIFMGGLGLGNAVLGPLADKTEKPLRLYGKLEFWISISAAASPFLVLAIERLYVALGGQSSLGLAGATALRLALSSLVLGVSTFLMGGTLPAAARAATAESDRERRALAWLYGVNTLGAVVGAMMTTFLFLEALGTQRTLWTACALNLLVAWIAIRHEPSAKAPAVEKPMRPRKRRDNQPSAAPQVESAESPAGLWLLYGASAVLGFAFFLMELVWYRMLGPLLGGTTFTFGLILTVALGGIGVGGMTYAVLFRRMEPTWWKLAFTCGLEAAAVGVPFALGDRIAVFAGRMAELGAVGFVALSLSWMLISCIVIFPAAVISGVQFPLLIALLGKGQDQLGRQIGYAYAWNTAGAILGSLAGGFGALPLLSAPGAWQAVIWLLSGVAAAASVVAMRSSRTIRWRWLVPSAAAIAVAGACTFAMGPTAVWRHSAIGAGRAGLPAGGLNSLRNWENSLRNSIAWEADGVESAIGITQSDGLAFIVNGKSDGNTYADGGTQVGLAIVGAMLHSDPQTAFVIGLGTGETAGWLADMRGLRRVDVVELEPQVDEMARRSREYNRDVLNNPRIRRIYNDAREVLLATRETYDLIVSEPSNPFRAGVATLYTREFYRSVRERLNRGGLFLQWLQGYEIDLPSAVMVMATLRSNFEHVEVWRTQSRDLLLVCANEAPHLDAGALRSRMQDPVLKEAMQIAWQAVDLEGFLSRFVAPRELVDYFIESFRAPINTDNHNRLEFGFAKTVGRKTSFSVGEMRAAAKERQLQHPAVAGQVDWTGVALNRVAMCVLSSEPEAEFDVQPAVHAVARGLDAFFRSDFAGARKELQSAAGEVQLPQVVRLFLAHCGAELGDAAVAEQIDEMASAWPVESAAMRTVLASRLSPTEGDRAYERLHELLNKHPWFVSPLVERALAVEYESALASKERARWLYDLLAAPYCGYRFEDERQWERFRLAKMLGAEATAEALEPYEPFVPWEENVLETRAQAYAAIGHRLAKRAAADLKKLRRDARRW